MTRLAELAGKRNYLFSRLISMKGNLHTTMQGTEALTNIEREHLEGILLDLESLIKNKNDRWLEYKKLNKLG